jgi:hypothetical protein
MKTREHEGLSRDELLAQYEHGVWLALAVIGGGSLALLVYFGYALL